MNNKLIRSLLITFLLLVASCWLLVADPLAQTTSPTPEPNESTSVDPDVVKDNIKKRIEQVVADKKDTIDEILENKATLKRAWIGTLESIANSTITIQTQTEARLASVSAQTTIIQAPKNTDLDLDELSLGDYLLVMGYVNGNEVMEAKRIVASSQTPIPELNHQPCYGQIITIDTKENSFTIKNSASTEITLLIDKKSVITDQDGQELELKNLTESQNITAIYLKTKDGQPTLTKAVITVPKETNSQEATPSAQTEPTPSPQSIPAELGN